MLKSFPPLLASLFLCNLERTISQVPNPAPDQFGAASSMEEAISKALAGMFNFMFPASTQIQAKDFLPGTQFLELDFKIVKPSELAAKPNLELMLMIKQLTLYLIASIICKQLSTSDQKRKSESAATPSLFVHSWKSLSDVHQFDRVVKNFISNHELIPITFTETQTFDGLFALYVAEIFLTRIECRDPTLMKFEFQEDMASAASNLVEEYYQTASKFLKYYTPHLDEQSASLVQSYGQRADFSRLTEKEANKVLNRRIHQVFNGDLDKAYRKLPLVGYLVNCHADIPLELTPLQAQLPSYSHQSLPPCLSRAFEMLFDAWYSFKLISDLPQMRLNIDNLNRSRSKLNYTKGTWKLSVYLQTSSANDKSQSLQSRLMRVDDRLEEALIYLKMLKRPSKESLNLVVEFLDVMLQSTNTLCLQHYVAIVLCALADLMIEEKELQEALKFLEEAEGKFEEFKNICPEYCIKKGYILTKIKFSAAREVVEAGFAMYSLKSYLPANLSKTEFAGSKNLDKNYEDDWIKISIEDKRNSKDESDWNVIINKQELLKLLMIILEQEMGKAKLPNILYLVMGDKNFVIEPDGFYPIILKCHEELKNLSADDIGYRVRMQFMKILGTLAQRATTKSHCYLLMLFERMLNICRSLEAQGKTKRFSEKQEKNDYSRSIRDDSKKDSVMEAQGILEIAFCRQGSN